MNELHVVHVVRDLDAASGGPSRSVTSLAEHQHRLAGVCVSVVYQDRGNEIIHLPASGACYLPQAGRGPLAALRTWPGSAPALPEDDRYKAQRTVVHVHGLWSPFVHAGVRWAKRAQFPLVISTRGMLASWAVEHKAMKKRLAWQLYQKADLRLADRLVASTLFERQDIERACANAAIDVLPNGCELPPENVVPDSGFPLLGEGRWALALGRLHPVKGYARLIEAWASLRPAGWKLAIAGPDEGGYRCYLEQLITKHQLGGTVRMTGPVDDAAKWSLLAQCELFIAPSETENFGMAIAEALAAGKPVITTQGTPWCELISHDCGWWIEHGSVALRQAIDLAVNAGEDVLARKGEHGKRLIHEKYGWHQVAERSMEIYRMALAAN